MVLPPVGNKTGVFCILEHKRMSDVCDRYLTRVKRTTEDQYASLRNVISEVISIDTSSRLEGRVDQLYHGRTFSEQGGPHQEPEVL